MTDPDLDELRADVGPFAILPEWVLLHTELSDRSVRLYALLIRHAGARGKAWPGRTRLAALLDCSLSAVDRCLRELRKAGALDVSERFTATGRQTSNVYTVRTVPAPYPSSPVTRGVVTGDDLPLVTGDDPVLLNESHEEREPTPTEPVMAPVTGDDDDRLVKGTTLTPHLVGLFERFWTAYPRKEGKAAAGRAWLKAARTVAPSVILRGAERYRTDPNRDPQFTAHAATWLNAGRWDDDPLPARSTAQHQPYTDPDVIDYSTGWSTP